MTKAMTGNLLGISASVLLLVCVARLTVMRMLSPNWAIALLVMGIVAILASLLAGWLSSKWWYALAAAAVLTVVVLFGFIGG